jgi:DHA1 family multidrug resistance protein-like MFS transporter
MDRSLWAVIFGTFTLRFSTGLTGAMLVYYLDDLPTYGGPRVDAFTLGLFTASFFAAELIFSPLFGTLADRFGYHRIMELGPAFGAVAVILTGLTTSLVLLGFTRWLEGASTAASVPAILGFLAIATVGDEGLRGRAVARFEAATLAGLGGGIVAAGIVYTALGNVAFFANAVLYGVSWCIYRFGVRDPRVDRGGREHGGRTTLARYLDILRGAHVWLLAPTWIAINAVIGLWTAQSIFQLIRDPQPQFADQMLMQGFSPLVVSAGLGVGMLIFFAGLVYWGNRFKRLRRTTIIGYGIAGGFVLTVAALALNHGAGLPGAALGALVVLIVGGLFVLAGATPAALGLLADMSEPYPADRGAIMGLYSVFLALGQIAGSLVGGLAADARGIDGLLVATVALLVVALLPLWRLRAFEHLAGAVGPDGLPGGGAGQV